MIPESHSHAPWRNAILIPFWTIQLGLEAILIGLLSVAVGFLVHVDNNIDDYNSSSSFSDSDEEVIEKAGKVVGPVWIALISSCLILTVTEIVLLARKSLKPVTFLITNMLKSAFWGVLFIIDIVAVVKSSSGSRVTDTVSLLIEAALLLSFCIPLIYASIIYHRFRTGKQYRPVNNPQLTPYTILAGAPAKTQGTKVTQYSNAPIPVSTMPEPYKGYGQQSISDVEAQQVQQGGRGSSYKMAGNGAASPPVPSVLVQHHDGHAYLRNGERR
ncbi:hypothetical protein WAI453_007907 [Rhynchosporium graminicola]|uniref:Uncharacterized protein n=1 Tax=Rhynchosporium graminicola TaxID=2792576 RepID=A0A1E1KUS6_9HELO|nr:uncharacterized protein RCO7_05397 [Rhynchosporium commune]